VTLDVVNQAPVWDPVNPLVLVAGAKRVIPVHVADPDPDDPLTSSLTTVPNDLRPYIHLSGESLTFEPPRNMRSNAPIEIVLTAKDTTTPSDKTARGDLHIGFTIRGLFGPASATVRGTAAELTGLFVARAKWNDPDISCLAKGACQWEFTWDFGDGLHGKSRSNRAGSSEYRHTYRKAGRYTTTVIGRLAGYGASIKTQTAKTTIRVAPDARKTLYVQTSARRRTLRVAIRSRQRGTLTIVLKSGRKSVKKSVKVRAGKKSTLGRTAVVVLPLKGFKSRVADLIVAFEGTLSSPVPPPLRRRVWIG
jgi:hypothetical protein